MMTEIAPAKVNLFLHVGPVQSNGRHPLDSLVVFAGPEAADRLSVEAADELTLSIEGPGAEDLDTGESNLVLQAAQALREATGVSHGARIHLEKHLPVAAGVGGGSADAAATLRLLTRLWQLDPGAATNVAPALGGDVPVALHGQPALMQGEGERVIPVSGLPQLPAILVNPNVTCPTGPVFKAYDSGGGGQGFRTSSGVPACDRAADLIDWLADQTNDLQAPAIAMVPEIGNVLEVLSATRGVRLSRMSGSGATCFALFATMNDAKKTADDLRKTHPEWWIQTTELGKGI